MFQSVANSWDRAQSNERSKNPFEVRVHRDGRIESYESEYLIDATGTWSNPNPLGSGGYFAIGENENSNKINYSIPDPLKSDRRRYAGKNVLVVGSGHSAVNTLLDLCRIKKEYPTTTPYWVLRKKSLESVYGGKQSDELSARGELGIEIEKRVRDGEIMVHHPFRISAVKSSGSTLTVFGDVGGEEFEIPGIDEIVANTGSRPDFSFLREVRYEIDVALECVPALAPLIDPNIHSCGTVPAHGEATLRQDEENFYIVGSKSYGRAPTFLMATGYEQVRSIVAFINGDELGARRIELNLPATGVCSAAPSNPSKNCCN